MKALIILNFKTYKEATGKKALSLVRKISKVRKNGYEIVICPPLLDLKEVIEETNFPIFSQHADPNLLGAHTGSIPVNELSQLGVKGTLLNHSERRVPLSIIEETIKACKRKKLITVVCASTLLEVRKIAELSPNYIAYEPPEFIGSNISVTQAEPKVILKAVEAIKQVNRKTKLLCGAGIHSGEDLGQSLLLGASGVLIGHAVPKAKDPKRFLEKMLI